MAEGAFDFALSNQRVCCPSGCRFMLSYPYHEHFKVLSLFTPEVHDNLKGARGTAFADWFYPISKFKLQHNTYIDYFQLSHTQITKWVIFNLAIGFYMWDYDICGSWVFDFEEKEKKKERNQYKYWHIEQMK